MCEAISEAPLELTQTCILPMGGQGTHWDPHWAAADLRANARPSGAIWGGQCAGDPAATGSVGGRCGEAIGSPNVGLRHPLGPTLAVACLNHWATHWASACVLDTFSKRMPRRACV